MAHSDSEDDVEVNDAFDFDGRSSDADEVNEDDLFDADDNADDATEHGEETGSEDEDEDAEAEAEAEAEEEEEEEDESMDIATVQKEVVPLQPQLQPPLPEPPEHRPGSARERTPEREHSTSPARARRTKLLSVLTHPRSYTVEAICAIAHPEPTHSLAASACMTHLITGSQDGYVRDYDVFAAVNGKSFLTAPQRAHCAVVEGTMKAGQLRMWWENPGAPSAADSVVEDHSRSPVTSLAMHSDALWALAGTEKGHINLFTVRHEPGQFITAMHGHRNLVSSLAMQHDEMGFFSAGWDGDVYQWDLNTGHQIRKFTSTGAQVAVVAVRPLGPILPPPAPVDASANVTSKSHGQDDDAKSDASYDPLFDDEPEEDENTAAGPPTKTNGNEQATGSSTAPSLVKNPAAAAATYPRGPPVLDSTSYGAYSPDILMTASIDGSIVLWDQRVNTQGKGVGRLEMSSKTPPWCVSACWSADGGQVYAGRRNCTVDVWDTRQFGRSVNGVPRLLKTLRNPISSGAVSCVAAFPDGRHIAVASNDNIRLWNASEGGEGETGGRGRSGVPFKIIPGHHGGIVSQLVIDPAARFMCCLYKYPRVQAPSLPLLLLFPPPAPMPKRYFDELDDGAPGEDDARYASATYNSMSALPLPHQSMPAGYNPAFASGSNVGLGVTPLAVPVAPPVSAPAAPDMAASVIPSDAPAGSTEEGEDDLTYIVTPEIAETMFREVHGRQLNTMQPVYQLPADDDEIKRQEYFHKLMYIVMGDKNHVGPIEEVLNAPSDRNRRILDIGTGSGIWAIQIADEFPDVEVIGCDLAPIQPKMVPPNCDFELFDAQLNPYANEYFDVVHARGVHTGMRNYPLFLQEVARILAPGGLVILVESEVRALTEGKVPIDAGPRGGAPGWHAFWEQYRRCLAGNHIDTTVPTRLGALLRATGAFEDVVAQEATVPIGFWPKDDNLLAVGEHAWMDHDQFVPAVRPLFLSYGLSEFRVKILVEDAQQDLYYPLTRPYSCVHVSHARKIVSWTPPRRRTRRLH